MKQALAQHEVPSNQRCEVRNIYPYPLELDFAATEPKTYLVDLCDGIAP